MMTFKFVFCWGIIFLVCQVLVNAVKSKPVGDEVCRMVKRGDCNCQCIEEKTTTWGSLADLYKRLFVRSFSPFELELHCTKCKAECRRHMSTNCINGVCHENGCQCAACWKGMFCDIPDNDFAPQFSQESYQAQIPDNAEPGSLVVTVTATDQDTKKCSKNLPCPCGEIIYFITQGNEDGLFSIERNSGNVRVIKNLEFNGGESIEITIVAENKDGSRESSTRLVVNVVRAKHRQRRSAGHHIVRRSVLTPSPSGIIVVSPVIQNNTFYKKGDVVKFNLTAYHNQSVGTANPTANLAFKCSSSFLSVIDKAFISSSGQAITNRAVSNGELTFQVATLAKAENIKIEFEVTVKTNIHPLSNLYLSCEATTTTHKIGPVASSPTLYAVFPKVTLARLTTPAQSLIEVDTTLDYQMTIEMPTLDFPLFVEITSAINDFSFMKVHSVQITQKGPNIGVGSGGNLSPTPQYHKSSNELDFHDRATLDFKNLTVSDGSSANSKIVIQWKVDLSDHPLVSNGSKYWTGAGLSSGSNMLHVAQQAVYAKKLQPTVSCTVTPKNNTLTNRFSIDDIISFDFECFHSNTSTANAQAVNLDIYSDYLQFISGTYTPSGGSATAVTPYNDTSLQAIHQAAFNKGQTPITGTLHTKVKDNMYPLVQLNVYIKVAYQNLAGKDKMNTTHKPAQPAIAAVPIMTLNISNPISCYKVGSIIDMDFKILLRKINSPLRVEMIAPVNASAPIIAIASVSTPVVGSNIIDSANLASKPINCKSTVNDTLNDRCTIDFGTVKSTTGIANSPLNEIAIKFKILLNDNPVIANGSKHWPAVGVRGGSRMMWIGEVAIKICSSADPKPVLKIESNCYIPNTAQTCCAGKLNKNDEVQYNITISHDNQKSEKHANKIKIIHMLPPYVVFTRELSKNPSRLTYVVGPSLTDTEPMRFLDKLSYSYIAKLDPEGKMPSGDIQATSIAEVSYVGEDVNKVFSSNTGVCCSYTSPPDPSQQKPVIESSPLPEWYNRGFLVIPSSETLVVCTENVAAMSCFYTTDGGVAWTAMSEQVGRVIGHRDEVLYAISSNKRAYMKQEKRGDTWFAITVEDWNEVKATASTNLKRIPDVEMNEADPTILLQDTSNNGYGANKLGVYYRKGAAGSWEKKATWKCCGAL